jgi:phage shock protein A
LQRALDEANKSVDDKLDKLEEAGIDVVGLTKKLEDARAKIVLLEDEVARLARREDRHMRRLEKMRCPKCLTRVNVRAIQKNLDERLVS